MSNQKLITTRKHSAHQWKGSIYQRKYNNKIIKEVLFKYLHSRMYLLRWTILWIALSPSPSFKKLPWSKSVFVSFKKNIMTVMAEINLLRNFLILIIRAAKKIKMYFYSKRILLTIINLHQCLNFNSKIINSKVEITKSRIIRLFILIKIQI